MLFRSRATAQGLLGAATSGIGMVVCGLLGGRLYESVQGGAFHAMAGIAALGVVASCVLRARSAAAVSAPPKP